MNTTELVVEMRPEKKFRPVPGFEPIYKIYKISAIGKSVSGLQRSMY